MRLMNKQKGVTLLELIIALGVMAAITVGVNALINQYSDDTKASVIATHIKRVGNAANSYIKDNYSTISSVATSSTPVLIRVSDLVAGGYLTAGYSTKNPVGQDTCILVLQPTPNNLAAIATTESGTAIDDLTLGKIAATIGGEGGGIYSTAVTTIRGAMGGYSFAVGNFANANSLGKKCDGTTSGAVTFTAGHPVAALWFADGNSTSSTLYRDSIPGNPSLNTMNTPIILGAGTVQVTDSACTTIGMLARDNAGKVLMCDGANWKEQGSSAGYWKDPVATYASLPTCDAAASSQTRVVTTPTVGTGPRAYTCNGSGSWQALGLDNAGNLTIAGTASINKLAGNLEITTVAVENTACPTNGTIARDSVGLILSCQSGLWKKATGSGIGESQTWTNMVGSAVGCASVRNCGVTCTNTTGKPIYVNIGGQSPTNSYTTLTVGGVVVAKQTGTSTGGYNMSTLSAIVPNGNTYLMSCVNAGNGPPGIGGIWTELR